MKGLRRRIPDREDILRRLRGTSGRGRKLRGLIELLRPYRWRVTAMFVSLIFATAAALAPAPLAKLAIDDGIAKGDVSTLDWVVVAFIVSALVLWAATALETYLVGWVGQRRRGGEDQRDEHGRHAPAIRAQQLDQAAELSLIHI